MTKTIETLASNEDPKTEVFRGISGVGAVTAPAFTPARMELGPTAGYRKEKR